MIKDPYAVLGLTPDATDEEVKQAYRKLAKKYHPDANPGDEAAAKKMQEINAAYDQIKNPPKQDPCQGGYGSGSYGGAGYGSGGYGQNSDPFGQWYRWQEQQARQQADQWNSTGEQAAYNYIQNGRYQEALNALGDTPAGERKDTWYYLSALASYNLGNRVTAIEHIRRAISMAPEKTEYQQILDQMENGGNVYRRRAGDFTGLFGDPSSMCIPFCLCCGPHFCC